MNTPEHLRARNVAALVSALRHHGSASRSELVRVTGLSRTTIVSIVDELARRGLLVERQEPAGEQRGRGRPAAQIRLHPSAGVALGICVGREDVRIALTDLSLTVLAHRHARFELDTAAETLLDLTFGLVDAALNDAALTPGDLIGVGLGLPSPLDPDTGAVDPSILTNWANRPVREIIAMRLGTHVAIENDANLEALAEVAMGAAKGFDDVLYVKVSWGIGGALVLGGRLRRGNTGSAGELAHVQVRDDGPLCRCGRRGCLGNFASGHTIVDALEALHGAHLDLEDVARLAATGHAGVCRVLADAGREIGLVLASLCSVLNPAAVIVGGELASTGSPLLSGMREGIERGALPASASVRILPAALPELGGALGAASLVARADDVPLHSVEWE